MMVAISIPVAWKGNELVHPKTLEAQPCTRTEWKSNVFGRIGWTHWWNDYWLARTRWRIMCRPGILPISPNGSIATAHRLKAINQKLAKLYQIKGSSGFWETQGCYDELEDDSEEI